MIEEGHTTDVNRQGGFMLSRPQASSSLIGRHFLDLSFRSGLLLR